MNNLTCLLPEILTISHATYLKYTQLYKRFDYDFNNFVSQFNWKIYDSTSNYLKKWTILPKILTISLSIHIEYKQQFYISFTWNSKNFTCNSPGILTILYAIYLKSKNFKYNSTRNIHIFTKLFVYYIQNFLNQFTRKIHDFTSNWLRKWTILHAF